MKTAVVLRIAAVLALLQGLAHGFLHVTYVPVHGPAESALVAAMKSHHFTFAGFDRTYWGFYFGYGLMVACGCLIQAALLWLLADAAKTRPAQLKPILALLCLANLAYGALAGTYFFVKPVVFDVAIAASLALAFALAGARPAAGGRGQPPANRTAESLSCP